MSQLCTARAALPSDFPISFHINAPEDGRDGGDHDLYSKGGASGFTYRFSFTLNEVWAITGPQDTVEALLKAVRIDFKKPAPQSVEEVPVENIDDMAPEP